MAVHFSHQPSMDYIPVLSVDVLIHAFVSAHIIFTMEAHKYLHMHTHSHVVPMQNKEPIMRAETIFEKTMDSLSRVFHVIVFSPFSDH